MHELGTENDEAAFIAAKIKELIDSGTVKKYSDV